MASSPPSGLLPDHIRPGVKVLFVGINPGLRSSQLGHHYAGHSNRFWKLLYEANCVPSPLTYHQDGQLPTWGYGLTNIVDRPTSGTHELTALDFSKGRQALLKKVMRYRPKLVALLGLTIRKALFSAIHTTKPGKNKPNSRPTVGLQTEKFGGALVFVLPNPSGRNAHYSYHEMLRLFRQLHRLNRRL
ncbi:mismatch-specific DNA-glycosylase [Candidatus Nitronereus thalassa]|uniref:Mismatch-specific DNA-glycosylase n=1 Tax=Candidatus Nitronereus thalassa TaxID=3020898 RepID=A0ABU3K557_9BACT|nr:mismatch-specific DNA-glycosylase [Candidatus Nitronereus thalassa]MDT7041497.1 mismatch-specific DNA-glycosylase [Candidatus Nitronereus thalassa]